MPGYLLTQSSQVACMHQGQGQATAPLATVQVAGQAVVTQAAPHAIAGCAYVTAGAPTPCVTAQWVSAATRVLAGGLPVLLADSTAVCAPNGTGVTVQPMQVRVKGT